MYVYNKGVQKPQVATSPENSETSPYKLQQQREQKQQTTPTSGGQQETVETLATSQGLIPVPSQIENYKLMEKRINSNNNLNRVSATPPREMRNNSSSTATDTTPTSTRNRLHSLNTDTLTPTLTSHLIGNQPSANIVMPQQQRTSLPFANDPAVLFSTSPPTGGGANYRFHIGSVPNSSSSSSPSSLNLNHHRMLFDAANVANKQVTNFGDPIMIDDLEEETILDVILFHIAIILLY